MCDSSGEPAPSKCLSATEGIVLVPQLRKLFLPLVHETGQLTCNVMNPLCKTCGITMQQFYVLSEVKAQPGLTISQLCSKSGVLQANFAVVFRKLENMGLLVKRPSEKDRRSHTLFLTPDAEGMLDQIDAEWNHQLESLLLKATPEELTRMADGLEALQALLKKVR